MICCVCLKAFEMLMTVIEIDDNDDDNDAVDDHYYYHPGTSYDTDW